MAREHNDAISLLDDLIATVALNSPYYTVKVRGSRAITRRISPLIFAAGIYISPTWKLEYEVQQLRGCHSTLEHARIEMGCHTTRPLLVASLVSFLTAMAPHIDIAHLLGQISGWKFDDLGITIRQRLCEALYAAGRTSRGCEVVLEMEKTFGKEVYTSKPVTSWVSGDSALPGLQYI